MSTSRKGIPHVVNPFHKKTSICPHCGGEFKSLGIARHRATCKRKKENV